MKPWIRPIEVSTSRPCVDAKVEPMAPIVLRQACNCVTKSRRKTCQSHVHDFEKQHLVYYDIIVILALASRSRFPLTLTYNIEDKMLVVLQ